jgi:hypothetical protein
MSSIKYYVLRTGEEPPMEFVAIRHVDGEPEFVASYVNSGYLSYENGVLLKMHERNDALRAENAKLREDNDRFIQAIEDLHNVSLEDKLVQLENENDKLRKLVDGLRYCANESHGHGRCSVRFVDGYVTYCPLYDVNSDTARCEVLLRELGMEG